MELVAPTAKHRLAVGQLILYSETPEGSGFCQTQLPSAVLTGIAAYGELFSGIAARFDICLAESVSDCACTDGAACQFCKVKNVPKSKIRLKVLSLLFEFWA